MTARGLRLAACVYFLLGSAAIAKPEGGNLFDDGNAAYLAGDPARAIGAYEALLAEGIASPELETNLGAAYLRQGKRGLAALHLERALALAPGDDDARADLAEVRRTNVDRLEGEGDHGAAEIFIRLLAPLPGGVAAVALAACWMLGWALFTLALLRPSRRPPGVAIAGSFALALICGAIAAGSAAGRAISQRRAVVTAASAPAREGPGSKSASAFEVHEGTAVSIEEELAGYSRVKLANGLTGWVESSALERVVPEAWRG